METELDNKMQNVISNSNKVACWVTGISRFIAVISLLASIIFFGTREPLLGIGLICNSVIIILAGSCIVANIELKQAQLMTLDDILDHLKGE